MLAVGPRFAVRLRAGSFSTLERIGTSIKNGLRIYRNYKPDMHMFGV